MAYHELGTPPAGISCRSPARPTCRTACCAPSTTRRSTIAARSSASSASRCSSKLRARVPDHRAGRDLSRPRAPAPGRRRSPTRSSPGDAVLMCRTGWFATLWEEMAERLQLKPEFIETDWRRGADVRGDRRGAGARHRASHQGGLRRPQRDLDRLRQPDRRGARGDGRGQASGAADGRYDLLARQHAITATTTGAWTSPSPARRRG